MGISTSDGQWHEDEFDFVNSQNLSQSAPSRADQESMTHQPEQPNPAEPYLKAIKNFSEGGIQQMLSGAGVDTPDWSKKVGEVLNSPSANAAIGMFGGRMSPAAVKTAEFLEKTQGVTPEAIKRWTGLERGADGMWRKEFSDDMSKLDLSNVRTLPEPKLSWTIASTSDHPIKSDVTSLGEILKHDELYKNYPEAKDITVLFRNDMKALGLYNPNTETISIRGSQSQEEIHSVLLHELQHYVQHKERFALDVPETIPAELRDQVKGYLIRKYGQEDMKKILDLSEQPGKMNDARYVAEQLLKKTDFKLYKHLASETEARNTQTRFKMDKNRRDLSLAKTTEDIDRENQIHRESKIFGN